MTKLGIIGAMQVEVEILLGAMENKTEKQIAGSVFYEGTLEDLPVVVVQCGVGKVNAAICAQILCSCYGVTHLVNTGIAGSLNAELDIGDLVVSRDAMYHDFDCNAFGYPSGKVPGIQGDVDLNIMLPGNALHVLEGHALGAVVQEAGDFRLVRVQPMPQRQMTGHVRHGEGMGETLG